MTHLIIGTCDAAIAALRTELREADPSAEIQLKTARDFDPERLSDAHKVYIVGDFPEIATAYGDRVQRVVSLEKAEATTADSAPSKKRK